ncbi:MAG: hypothetical protein IGS48_02420 [Oscillatoriales cyanobacterium C42_A2020_001]|nr:hypothetical protein [Leptolyngbyaceae cyanobacterium C42_A2020_001]
MQNWDALKAYFENPDDEKAWKEFIKEVNDATSQFNKGVSTGDVPLSNIDNKPIIDPEEEKKDKK